MRIGTVVPLAGLPTEHQLIAQPENCWVGDIVPASEYGLSRLVTVAEVMASQAESLPEGSDEAGEADDLDDGHLGGWVVVGSAPDCDCQLCRRERKAQHRACKRETFRCSGDRRAYVRARECERMWRREGRRRYEMPG